MRGASLAASLVLLARTLPNQNPAPPATMPPCGSGFHAGQTLTMSLGVT